MAFNGFPYVNFADLNLDWLLSRIQDVLTLVNSANEQSDDAIELATEANERTLTYSQQIADATADAEEALGLAQDSQDILVIYPDNEGKPVNYKKYMNGETEYIGTDEILTELTLHKRIPFFMDRNQNVFILHGFLDSGTSNTKARFVRSQGNITFFAIIDRNQTISYNSTEDGSLYNVSFNYSDSELVEGWSSDKTFSEILSAINSGKTISLTIKYNGEIRDVVTGTHLTSTSPSVIYFGYTKGVSEVYPMDTYTNAFAYFTINSSGVVTQQSVRYVPNSSTQISGYVLTVNSNGIPEWLPASGGGGSANAVLYVEQTLTAQQQARARQNIGAGMSTVSYDPSIAELTIETGSGTAVAYMLPIVAQFGTADAGKFYRVNSAGTAAGWEAVPAAESNSFGGV